MIYNPIKIRYYQSYELKPFKKASEISIQSCNHDTEYKFDQNTDIEFIKSNIDYIMDLNCKWREIYKISFDLRGIQHIPGDAIGVLCPNNDEYVSVILKKLNLTGNETYKINRRGFCPFEYQGIIKDFFKYKFDFNSLPKKAFLYDLSKDCEKKEELEYICSTKGNRDYLCLYSNYNNILDIIEYFGIRPKLETLIEHCEIIKPRYFSLINKESEKMEIIVGLMHNTGSVSRYGHCSNYFKMNLYNKNLPIEVTLRENKLLRMKKVPSMLLICTGVGIAPFLSFIKNKEKTQHIWLIYGFRYKEDDILEKELGKKYKFYENRIKISKAISSEGVHVDDIIKNNDKEIREFLNINGLIYVCGSMSMQKQLLGLFKEKFTDLSERINFDSWN
ncbi:Methionine synthase reductase [Astathelohania contejeani]|uniref:Methionine synthase reductase n=1 Tax=Astathelohania contejeani TaxID=164912 RepID=A0ABQ7I0E4_9MICR|nr:Methionine synthase reductase [Thelohania contejeani]